jgi:hypothetical protein
MTAIQVDTQILRQAAAQLEDLAGRMRVASKDVLDATQGAPTIEGQFGPEVRALGMELFAKIEDRHQQLSAMASELADFADRFDVVDQASLPELQSVFLQWLAQSGVILPDFDGAGMQANLGTPLQQGPAPPADEQDENSWLDYLLAQFDLEQAWDTVTEDWVAGWLSRAKDLPRFTVALPWIRGFGPSLPPEIVRLRAMLGLTDDLAGPLLRQVDTGFLVRSFGRLVGDASIPPLFMIGWGLTLAPEQIRNFSTDASWNERLADGVVDSGNFLVGEAAGWAVGLLSAPEAGPGAIGVKLVADVVAGAYYDSKADQFNWRELLTKEIGEIPDEALRGLAEASQRILEQEALRIPTPEILPAPTGTPSPPGSALLEASPGASPDVTPNPSPDDRGAEPTTTPTPSP